MVLGGVTDDGGVVARCTCKRTTVTNFLLNVADDGTFGTLAYRKNIANGESGLLAAVNEGTGMKTLSSDEGFLAKLVAIRVTEDDTCKWCPANPGCMSSKPPMANVGSPARIVNDFLDDTTEISVALCVVESAEFGGCLVVVSVRLELQGEGGKWWARFMTGYDVRWRASASVP